jgi:subtilase family serine protease
MKNVLNGLTRALGRSTVLATAAVLALGATAAQAGVPYPTKATPQARDLGAATDAAITVTVSLKHRDADKLESLAASLYTPGDAQFHKFLSSAEFHQRFDPSAESIAKVTAWLQKAGLSVKHEGGHMLEVTGSAAQLQAAFGVGLRAYEVPAHGKSAAYRFHAATGAPSIAQADVAALVDSVVGLDSFPRYAPNSHRASPAMMQLVRSSSAKKGATGNRPGEWTVNDLASYYNVTPLYDAGVHGEGQTIAIVTLANFTPSDAFQYWSDAGLTVDQNRLRIVNIDGGPGPVSDAGGSGETTLDVEQSGGLAPAADMIVYMSPNTDHSFTHAFAKAVNDNVAGSISVSWGEFEWFETLGRTKARRGNVEYLKAFNEIFLQAAVQGQSMIAASGDEGAYEANRALPAPQFTETLSVGSPGSSPWITAAGGTTVPTTLNFSNGVSITVSTEQAWGWDYLRPLCQSLGLDDFQCGIWGAGSGGGVSSYFRIPSYQKKVDGMRVTEAGQSLIDTSTGIDYVDLPAGFAGRNVPDVSLNADPETGYIIDYTDENGNYGTLDFYGGTSFVAPQLNGIAALVAQNAGGRVGLLNFPIYQYARKASGWTGKNAPFNDITAGDNWFYSGVAGYDQATGVGTLNVANFAKKVAGQ